MGSKTCDMDVTDIDFALESTKIRQKRVVSCEQAIEESGFGKLQIFVFLASYLILGNTVSETMGISYVIPAAVCDLNLTPSDKGLLTGMTFFGVMAGSHFFGFLADTQGRRKVVLWALLGSTISTTISVFIKNFTVFLVLRFLSGFFVAGYSAVIYAYLGEYNILKRRASILSWVTTSVGFSLIVMPALAYWIIAYEWRFELYSGYEFRPWRLLIILYSLLGVAGGTMLLFLKESPKFLLTAKRDDEALEVIRWMYKLNKGSDYTFDIARLEPEDSPIADRNATGLKGFLMSVVDQTWTLLKPPHVKYFLTCCCLHVGLFAVSGGIALFMPDILNKLAIARTKLGHDLNVCDVYDLSSDFFKDSNSILNQTLECIDVVNLSTYTQSMFVGAGYLVGFIIVSIIITPSTRVWILAFDYTIAAISGVVLMFFTSSFAIVGLFTMFIFFTGVNVSAVNSAGVDIFPTYLRSMAICVSMMFGRLGTTISTNILGITLENYCRTSFFTFSGICVCCAALSFVLPRPKRGSF